MPSPPAPTPPFGYPPEEFGLAGTALARTFTDRARRALEASRLYPSPHMPELPDLLDSLLTVGEHAQEQGQPVTWG